MNPNICVEIIYNNGQGCYSHRVNSMTEGITDVINKLLRSDSEIDLDGVVSVTITKGEE